MKIAIVLVLIIGLVARAQRQDANENCDKCEKIASSTNCLSTCQHLWPDYECTFICQQLGLLKKEGPSPCIALGFCRTQTAEEQQVPEPKVLTEKAYRVLSSDDLAKIHKCAEDAQQAAQERRLLLDEISTLKSQIKSLNAQLRTTEERIMSSIESTLYNIGHQMKDKDITRPTPTHRPSDDSEEDVEYMKPKTKRSATEPAHKPQPHSEGDTLAAIAAEKLRREQEQHSQQTPPTPSPAVYHPPPSPSPAVYHPPPPPHTAEKAEIGIFSLLPFLVVWLIVSFRWPAIISWAERKVHTEDDFDTTARRLYWLSKMDHLVLLCRTAIILGLATAALSVGAPPELSSSWLSTLMHITSLPLFREMSPDLAYYSSLLILFDIIWRVALLRVNVSTLRRNTRLRVKPSFWVAPVREATRLLTWIFAGILTADGTACSRLQVAAIIAIIEAAVLIFGVISITELTRFVRVDLLVDVIELCKLSLFLSLLRGMGIRNELRVCSWWGTLMLLIEAAYCIYTVVKDVPSLLRAWQEWRTTQQ